MSQRSRLAREALVVTATAIMQEADLPVTIDEARRIAVAESQDGLLHLRRRIEDDRRVAEALALLWRTFVPERPTAHYATLVDAVEARLSGEKVWSWS